MIHLPFPNTISYTTFGYLPLTVQHQCCLQDATPFQWLPDAFHSVPPREVEHFPWGGKYFKHVPPLTYLIYFLQKGVYMVGSIYMPKPAHKTLISHWLVLNQGFKNPICWMSLAFQKHNFIKMHFKIAPSKNAFQKCYFKTIHCEITLKECISKVLFQ